MIEDEAKEQALALIERSRVCMVGSNGEGGYPQIKAMYKVANDGLETLWFSTNTSSKRVARFLKDPKAAVYFIDTEKTMGLLLNGKMEVLQDHETKARFWFSGAERYYPLGVDDPDYSVLRFIAEDGNCYHRLQNLTFKI